MKYVTPVRFYEVEEDSYQVGELNELTWSAVAEDNGTSLYFCKWGSTYGAVKAATMTAGVMETAYITMPYAPKLYEALKSGRIVVARGGLDILTDGEPDRLNPNCYELYSGVDNPANRTMSFIVKRYEGK